MRKTISFLLYLLVGLTAVCHANVCYATDMETLSISDLCEGDLLFCTNLQGNNITDVTQGIGGLKIDHVAIFHRITSDANAHKTQEYALEAIHKGVCLTPIDSFMARREMVVCARLKDTLGVAHSVERAMRYIGKPYDFNFMPDDSAFYCSELVQKCYKRHDGELIFKPIPMSFHDKSGKITKFWHDYYAKQNMKVPEGEPGSNPGDLSRSDAVMILGILRK